MQRFFKGKNMAAKITVCVLLLIAALLFIAVTEAKKNAWFDEKELYSFSKVFEQNEQGIVAHIFYYRNASGYIQQISYDLSSEGATFLEYSDNITIKKDTHICSVILTPLENDLWDYEFLLCQYKE